MEEEGMIWMLVLLLLLVESLALFRTLLAAYSTRLPHAHTVCLCVLKLVVLFTAASGIFASEG